MNKLATVLVALAISGLAGAASAPASSIDNYNTDPGGGGAYCYGRYAGMEAWARFDWAPDYYGYYICGSDGYWHYQNYNGYRISWWGGLWASQLVSTGAY